MHIVNISLVDFFLRSVQGEDSFQALNCRKARPGQTQYHSIAAPVICRSTCHNRPPRSALGRSQNYTETAAHRGLLALIKLILPFLSFLFFPLLFMPPLQIIELIQALNSYFLHPPPLHAGRINQPARTHSAHARTHTRHSPQSRTRMPPHTRVDGR